MENNLENRKEIEITITPKQYDANKSDLLGWLMEHKKSYGLMPYNYLVIRKVSLDARKKNIIYRVRLWASKIELLPDELKNNSYYKKHEIDSKKEVFIIGAGPAGLFCALQFIQLGCKPIIIERGKDVKNRRRDVAVLNKENILNGESNYCFGEGGAGTFSDGKLYTRSGKRGSINQILNILVGHGAKKEILFEAHPHIGTNKLPAIIENIRNTIIECGGEVRFNTKLTDIILEHNKVKAIEVNGNQKISISKLVLATGHSAKDIFELLHRKKIKMEAKPFAMGFRVEHPQGLINNIQYHHSKDIEYLPPASYKLVTQVENKGVFSFCMCPGGIIAPAATHQNEMVVNGWSPSKRNGSYANSGIVTSVNEEDWVTFNNFGVLAGLKFQHSIEEKCSALGNHKQLAPAQNLIDYFNNVKSDKLVVNSYIPGLISANLNNIYPPKINERLKQGLLDFTKKMKGFRSEKAILVAPESRTSSPIKIPRNKELVHPDIEGLYPCGEGAGFAGGIVSAAIDGVRVAQNCVI